MKILLSLLLCFLFLNAETNAQQSNIASNGGPNYGSLGNLNGTYAGVLTPSTGSPTNALGLFDLVLKTTGIGVGSFLVFENGLSFSGTIDAIGDPTTFSIKGILQAGFYQTFPFINIFGVQSFSQQEIATANGALTASAAASQSAGGSAFGTALTGTATVSVVAINGNFFNSNIDLVKGTQTFIVDGFQQSASQTSLQNVVTGT